jgi:Pyruvate/2-oxoacid:ferredoxin oxidoreductase delta subunit
MTLKEKAEELVEKFMVQQPMHITMTKTSAKQCAKICVDEIISALTDYDSNTEDYIKNEFGIDYFSVECQNMDSDFRYWDKVKNEIDKY